MKEPFNPVKKHQLHDVVYDQDGNIIPEFSMSRYESCYWNLKCDIEAPEPITDELNEIFDIGSTCHENDMILQSGARNIIRNEMFDKTSFKIVHESEKFIWKGRYDYRKFDFRGRYIEDLKSTKKGGLYYFLREGVSDRDLMQISGYSYMAYIYTSVWDSRGVIKKIDKEEPLNTVSLVRDLYDIVYMRRKLIAHPVVQYIIGNISEDDLIDLCTSQMQGNDWMCTNCQYNDEEHCPVRGAVI